MPEILEKVPINPTGYLTDPRCEISDSPGGGCWYEDGVDLLSKNQGQVKKDSKRKLNVPAVQASESGWYDSLRKDDPLIRFEKCTEKGDF